MVKLQQKVGPWRTLEGARNFCAIRSYALTLRKQDLNVIAGLRQLFEGQAWITTAGAWRMGRAVARGVLLHGGSRDLRC